MASKFQAPRGTFDVLPEQGRARARLERVAAELFARATGAPVYCPKLEVGVLADIMSYVPWPGFGPYESYDADETVSGGEKLELAGFEIDVIFTPGHSPGHVTYSIPAEKAIFSGDVLFQGSVGRVDLPGADWDTLLASVRMLAERLPPETVIHAGHGPETTLGVELARNPFLAELRAEAGSAGGKAADARPEDGAASGDAGA